MFEPLASRTGAGSALLIEAVSDDALGGGGGIQSGDQVCESPNALSAVDNDMHDNTTLGVSSAFGAGDVLGTAVQHVFALTQGALLLLGCC